MRGLAGVRDMEMFGLDLAHALLAFRPRIAARGGISVLGVEQQIAPQAPHSARAAAPIRAVASAASEDSFSTASARLSVCAVQRGVLRVGADAVFPIGPKVAADGLELVCRTSSRSSRNNREKSPVADAARRIWHSSGGRIRPRRGPDRCFPSWLPNIRTASG